MDGDEMTMEYQIAFELIAVAGDSKAESMAAIEAASEFRFEEAQELLKSADEKMAEAHHIQTDILQREASGQKKCTGGKTICDHSGRSAGSVCAGKGKRTGRDAEPEPAF